MKKSLLKPGSAALLGALLATGMFASAAFASDGTITINGAIGSQTCSVTAASANMTVTLPKVAASAFVTSQTAGTTPFFINVTGCASGTQVGAFFEGGPTIDYSNVQGTLLNTAASSPSSGVNVQLVNQDGSTVLAGYPFGSVTGTQIPAYFTASAAGAATLPYFARYIKSGTIGAGAYTSTVTYSLVYP